MITIKEEFVGGIKITRAIEIGGWPALGLWLAMKCYAAENLTDGFIPDEVIDKLRGAPKNPRKLLPALVECGSLKPDGSRKSGLVDQHPHGWQLHDYLDHANSAEQEHERRRKERVRKAAYRAGQKPGQSARDTTRDNGTAPSHVPQHVPRDTHAQAPARAPVGTRTRAPSPAQPSPAQPEREARAPVRDRLAESLTPPSTVELHAFAAWATAWGKTGATYDARRASCLIERVNAGMTALDADDAIAGALADDWVNGTKDGQKKTKLTVIFGDADSFEDYRDKGRALRERPSGTIRKGVTEAERQQREIERENARRAAEGLRPLTAPEDAVRDPAELDRILGGVAT